MRRTQCPAQVNGALNVFVSYARGRARTHTHKRIDTHSQTCTQTTTHTQTRTQTTTHTRTHARTHARTRTHPNARPARAGGGGALSRRRCCTQGREIVDMFGDRRDARQDGREMRYLLSCYGLGLGSATHGFVQRGCEARRLSQDVNFVRWLWCRQRTESAGDCRHEPGGRCSVPALLVVT